MRLTLRPKKIAKDIRIPKKKEQRNIEHHGGRRWFRRSKKKKMWQKMVVETYRGRWWWRLIGEVTHATVAPGSNIFFPFWF